MADNIPEEIRIELDQVEKIVSRLLSLNQKIKLSEDEVNSAALMLMNFYNGIENIFKQLIRINNKPLPNGERWHKELLDLIISQGWLPPELNDLLLQYMKFRHFVTHSYTFHIEQVYLTPLLENVSPVFNEFSQSILKIF